MSTDVVAQVREGQRGSGRFSLRCARRSQVWSGAAPSAPPGNARHMTLRTDRRGIGRVRR
jgi:hypothetical protein